MLCYYPVIGFTFIFFHSRDLMTVIEVKVAAFIEEAEQGLDLTLGKEDQLVEK